MGTYLEAILEETCLRLGYFEGHGEGEMGWCGWLGRGQVGSSLESRRGARSITFYEDPTRRVLVIDYTEGPFEDTL